MMSLMKAVSAEVGAEPDLLSGKRPAQSSHVSFTMLAQLGIGGLACLFSSDADCMTDVMQEPLLSTESLGPRWQFWSEIFCLHSRHGSWQSWITWK